MLVVIMEIGMGWTTMLVVVEVEVEMGCTNVLVTVKKIFSPSFFSCLDWLS